MKKNYTGLIALGMALVMAVSLVCFSIPSTATGDTSGTTSSGESTTKGGSGASATSGDSGTKSGSGASASSEEASTGEKASEEEATEEAAAEENDWYTVAERVDIETLPESLHDFLNWLVFYHGDYDRENPIPEEGEAHLLYNVMKTYRCVDYSLYPGLKEGSPAFIFDEEMRSSMLEEDKDAEVVSADPLRRYFDDTEKEEEEGAEDEPAEPMMLIGYHAYPAEEIDWVLRNIFYCSPSAIAKMRTITDPENLGFDGFYYYKGDYIVPIETGLGGPTYSAHLLDAYYDGKAYDLYYWEGLAFNSYPVESVIVHSRVSLETIGDEEYWTLHKREVLRDGIPMEVITEKSGANKKQIAAAEKVIEKIGFENASDAYDIGHAKEDQLVLLRTYGEGEENGLSVYEIIPAGDESNHTILIRKEGGDEEIRRFIAVPVSPEFLDLTIGFDETGLMSLTWCTRQGAGMYLSEMLLVGTDYSDMRIWRIPTDKICEQLAKILEMRFDPNEARLEIADLRTKDFRLLGVATGDPEDFEDKKVEEMSLSKDVRKYSFDGFPTLQLCIRPDGEGFEEGMFLADLTVTLYPEFAYEEDLDSLINIGVLTEVNMQ